MDEITSHCSKCDKYKPRTPENFFFSKGKFNGGYCKPCTKTYKKSIQADQNSKRQARIKTDPDLLAYIRSRDRDWRRRNPALHLLSQVKNRSKRLGLEFNLELSDIIIPDKCPLLEIKFVPGVKGNYMHSYSLDRIDSTKGYIKGNVRVISMLANTMKNSASKEQLLIFAKNLTAYLDE